MPTLTVEMHDLDSRDIDTNPARDVRLKRGIEDVSNELGAFTVLRAGSHEAAAKLFEKHPHFTNFPGECIEIMPVLPIPGA